MAQPQTQAKAVSSYPRRTSTSLPTRVDSGALTWRDPLAGGAGPFGLMRRLSEDMDQLFGQIIGRADSTNPSAAMPTLMPLGDWVPAIETFTRDGKFIVQADLPGMDADDVTVEFEDGTLMISGERQEEREIDSNGFRRSERRYGAFTRAIALPEGVKAEDVQAAVHNGVLEISVTLPRSSQQRRTIDVKKAAQHESGQTSAAPSSSDSGGNGGGAKAKA